MGIETMRNRKQREQWIQKYKLYRRLSRDVRSYGKDIFESEAFQSNKHHIQHGNVTVNEHCINVANTSLRLNRLFGITKYERELARGALLHDYFLYDWHVGEKIKPWKLHGFYHPGIALRNAKKEYELTDREQDIIRKHMWPLTIVPPTCREGWIVTCADKWCSIMETFHVYRGHGIPRKQFCKAKVEK